MSNTRAERKGLLGKQKEKRYEWSHLKLQIPRWDMNAHRRGDRRAGSFSHNTRRGAGVLIIIAIVPHDWTCPGIVYLRK